MALNVVITDCDLGPVDEERRILSDGLGDVVVTQAQCRTTADVIAAAADADALLVQWAPVDAAVLEALTRCRVISRYGIGLDMIDLDAAARRGIEVRNVPHYCTEEVASHAVALLLALWRRLPQLDASVRRGEWNAGAHLTAVPRLTAATLGLVGLGRIASGVARSMAAMGVRVVAYDPFAAPVAGITSVSLEELAAESDLISLHCPLTDETRGLVGEEFLSRVRPHAVLVNTARGPLVDDDAVITALLEGRLGGAGLDVFEEEPLPADHPLRATPNTLLGPHAAWCSASALPNLKSETAANVVRFFAERGPVTGEPVKP